MNGVHCNRGNNRGWGRKKKKNKPKSIAVLFKKYRQLHIRKIVVETEKGEHLIYLQVRQHGVLQKITLEAADKIILERRVESLALHRSRKRLGVEKEYIEMNPIEKKVVALTAKKWRILIGIKKRKEAENTIKERRGKPRHRHKVL